MVQFAKDPPLVRLCENSIGGPSTILKPVLSLLKERTVKYLILLTYNPFVLRPLEA